MKVFFVCGYLTCRQLMICLIDHHTTLPIIKLEYVNTYIYTMIRYVVQYMEYFLLTYHHSQVKISWLKMVPFGQRKDMGYILLLLAGS